MTGQERLFVVIVAGIFGLALGSFLNVVIYRVPRGQSIVQPGSRCPGCLTPLRSRDNIPLLSWILLGGRCRYCQEPISPRYPFVEGATAGCFAMVGAVAAHLAVVPPLLVGVTGSICAAAIDLDGFELPIPIVSLFAIAAGWLLVLSVMATQWSRVAWAAIGALATGAAWLLAARPARTHSEGRGRRHPLRPLVVTIGLGCCAGWLWGPGGLVLAATVWLATVVLGRTRAPAPAPLGSDEPSRAGWAVALWPACLLGLAALLLLGAVSSG